MFRFTIRDVLWLTVVVALLVAWGLDRRQLVRALSRSEEAARILFSLVPSTGDHIVLKDGTEWP
jgi:TRAP-type C4-dicarboxylate transport system permease small subunit